MSKDWRFRGCLLKPYVKPCFQHGEQEMYVNDETPREEKIVI